MASTRRPSLANLNDDDISVLTGKPVGHGILRGLRDQAGAYAPAKPSLANIYTDQVRTNGLMNNQQAAGSAYQPNITIGGNFGMRAPQRGGPSRESLLQSALTERFSSPDFNADGRYFQGAGLGTNAQGRPVFTDRTPRTPVNQDRRIGLLEAMEREGKGYFDEASGRFMGNAPQRPTIAPAPAATTATPASGQPTSMDLFRQRQAQSQQLVTQRAMQRASDRRDRMRGPSLMDVMAQRSPQFALGMAALNQRGQALANEQQMQQQQFGLERDKLAQSGEQFGLQQALAQERLGMERTNAERNFSLQERQMTGQQGSKGQEASLAALIGLINSGMEPRQAFDAVTAMGGGLGGATAPAASGGQQQPSLANLPPGPTANAAPQRPTIANPFAGSNTTPEPARKYFLNSGDWEAFVTMDPAARRQLLIGKGVASEEERTALLQLAAGGDSTVSDYDPNGFGLSNFIGSVTAGENFNRIPAWAQGFQRSGFGGLMEEIKKRPPQLGGGIGLLQNLLGR